MDVVQDLGVQSYCFRGFKENTEVAAKVKQCGLSKVELCACHADFADESGFDEIINTYTKAGVGIVCIGVEGFANNEATDARRFEFAKRAGAKVISCSFDIDSVPDSYRTVEKLAEKHDVYLAIHNHGGGDWLGCPTMLEHVFSKTSERIGLCLDTAWALDSGADPVDMAERFSKRLYGVHIKDFVFDKARRPKDVVVGQGNLDLGKLLAVLKGIDFDIATVLEYEGDVDNPVPALKQCVEAVQAAG